MGLVVKGAELGGERVDLRAEAGLIAAITAVAAGGIEPEPGDEVLDGDGTAIVGGLVNAHTHAAMTLFRGYADDLPLMEWLERHVWPAERRLTADDVYWGTRLACLELARGGTAAFWDMYWHPAAAARAARDTGVRAVCAAPLIDGRDPAESRARTLAAIDEVAAEVAGGDEELVRPGIAPHAIYTVGPESLEWVAALAHERDLSVQIHLSETEDEVADCVREHGLRPAFLLDRCGLLGPRTLLGHGVWLDRDELGLIAERGATVITNPVANMKLAVGGVFPYPAAREAGVAVGLGTDGAGSNNSLDMLADAKQFALVQKHEAADPAVVDAAEVIAIAQGRMSPRLGGRTVESGAPADLFLAELGSPALALGELDAGLVYAASGSVVRSTVVAGRVAMRDREVDGAAEVVAKARERAAGLFAPR